MVLETRLQRAAWLSVALWGKELQHDMVEEEALELALAICHHRRGRLPLQKVLAEAADNRIMYEQLVVMYGENRLERHVWQKLRRHEDRILQNLIVRRIVLLQCPRCDAPMTHRGGETIDVENDELYTWNEWRCSARFCFYGIDAEPGHEMVYWLRCPHCGEGVEIKADEYDIALKIAQPCPSCHEEVILVVKS